MMSDSSQQASQPERPSVDLHAEALRQVKLHHDKAGLAARFRVDDAVPEDNCIDVVDAADLPADAFWRRYVANNLPVVVRNAVSAAQGWTPSISFTAEGLTSLVGHASVRVRTLPQAGNVFGDVTKLSQGGATLYDFEQMSLAEFLTSLKAEPPQYYAARLELQEHLPELQPEVPSQWTLPFRTAFGVPYRLGAVCYIGAKQQATPLHYDDLENMAFVVQGAKHYTLFPPSQSCNLYPSPQRLNTHYSSAPMSAADPASPQADAWPLVQTARGVSVTVPAGSMLYLPCCWWHSVRGSDDLNVAFNYWYCQSPQKEDAAIYRAQLQQETDHWLKQLSTMDLMPAIMREAYDEAPNLIEHKAGLREKFNWQYVE